MSHIHELNFIEKGGVKCSTLGCRVYYSEEHIIQILERFANENASQQSVQADLQPCGHPKKNLVTDEKGATYCFSCAVASR